MDIPLDPERKVYLETLFPGLATTPYRVRGSPDRRYNCVSWALGVTDDWYWPAPFATWPGRLRQLTVPAFTSLFQSMGFEWCDASAPEAGFVKIVLYVQDGVPSHVAKVEAVNLWSSKLGRDELLEHEPDALNGSEYGLPAFYFRRRLEPSIS